MLLDADWDTNLAHFVRVTGTGEGVLYEFFTSKGVQVGDERLADNLYQQYVSNYKYKSYVWNSERYNSPLAVSVADKLAEQMREEQNQLILDKLMKHQIVTLEGNPNINKGDTVTIRMATIGLAN